MKKTITIVTLALLVFACSRKTTNTAQTTTTTPATTTESSASATETTAGNTEHASLVEQGKIVYTTRCNRCHGLKDVTAFTTTRWDGILKNMIPKAKLDATQAQQVTAYVMENARK